MSTRPIYPASRSKWREMWCILRNLHDDMPIRATWLDAVEVKTEERPEFVQRCLDEAHGSDVVLFIQPKETGLAVALAEAGAALAGGGRLHIVAHEADARRIAKMMVDHPRTRLFDLGCDEPSIQLYNAMRALVREPATSS